MDERNKRAWDAARDALERQAPYLLRVTREHGLSLEYQAAGPDVDCGHPSAWYNLLRIGTGLGAPWPRTELKVNVRTKPECAEKPYYLWAYVDDAVTGKRVVDVADMLGLHDLAPSLLATLVNFTEKVRANAGVNPYEAERARMGTKYYWAFSSDDDEHKWSTDFGPPGGFGSKCSAEYYPDRGVFAVYKEGITGPAINGCEIDGEGVLEVLLRIEGIAGYVLSL